VEFTKTLESFPVGWEELMTFAENDMLLSGLGLYFIPLFHGAQELE
jgi:hypothetical protein